jgi:uncharacterized protein YwgA
MGDLKKVIACMKEMGRRPKVENFQDKLVIQKAVCLLELLGLDMKYRFSIYVRGPYSPDLAADLYANKELVENLKTDYAFTKAEKELIAKISEASNNLEPALLEIMATYAFLSKKCSLGGKEAIAELKKIKPFYSEAKIAVGISRARQLFPPTEKEIEGMKNEFQAWEEAGNADARY